MPFTDWRSAPEHVKRRGQQAAEKWVRAWNHIFAETSDESKAFAYANSSIAAGRVKIAAIHITSDVFDDWKPDGKYEVEYIRSGYWSDFNGTGELFVTNEDLADAIVAFRKWKAREGWATDKRRPFLDYNHGITNPEMSDRPNIAAGWMADAWIQNIVTGARVEPAEAAKSAEPLSIRATYEVTEEGNDDIKTKRRALFSPTFISAGRDEKSGVSWKFEILGGGLVNIPFFEGMDGFRALAASAVCNDRVWNYYQGSAASPGAGSDVTRGKAGKSSEGIGNRTPAEAAGSTGAREGGNMDWGDKRVAIAKALRLPETATDAEIDEKLASQAAIAAKAPAADEVTVKREEFEAVKADAAVGRAAAKKLAEQTRDAKVKAAIDDFKISKAKEAAWKAKFDEDPVGTEATLDLLEPNPAFRGEEVGSGQAEAEGKGPHVAGRPRNVAVKTATMKLIDSMVDEKVKEAGGKLTALAARREVWDERPDLYEAYRRETTRNRGAGGEA